MQRQLRPARATRIISQRVSRRVPGREDGRRPFVPDDLEDDILIITVVGLVASLFLSAVARRLAPEHHPVLIEAASICLTWITTIGASRAAALGVHVRVLVLADLFPPDPRRKTELFADAVMLLVALGLFGIGCSLIHYSLANPVPRGHPLVYAAVPVGMGLAVFRLCQRLARTWRGRA